MRGFVSRRLGLFSLALCDDGQWRREIVQGAASTFRDFVVSPFFLVIHLAEQLVDLVWLCWRFRSCFRLIECLILVLIQDDWEQFLCSLPNIVKWGRPVGAEHLDPIITDLVFRISCGSAEGCLY